MNIEGKDVDFEILNSFEFDSDRKRMSVIIRDKGVIKLFIKGADSIIISRLNKNIPQPFLANIKEKLEEFSKRGLRTLCIAMRVIEEDEYKEFNSKYKECSMSADREKEISIPLLSSNNVINFNLR